MDTNAGTQPETTVYAMSHGSYDDYRIHRFIRGVVGADFNALYNEFCAEYHRRTPPYAVPEPEAPIYHYNLDNEQLRADYNKAYDEWREDLWDFERTREKTWNEQGYYGSEKDELFVSWLVKDRGFEQIDYEEIQTDMLYNDERYLTQEPRT